MPWGPITAALPTLNLFHQFWTSRGFAVLDLNYRGSTGYGREFRQHLEEQCGLLEANNVIQARTELVDKGWIDGDKVAITGKSAGGYTALQYLTMTEIFAAAACHYGISDLELFITETHKFESHYLDWLIGLP